jgi:hypothetical protein
MRLMQTPDDEPVDPFGTLARPKAKPPPPEPELFQGGYTDLDDVLDDGWRT